MLKAFLDPSVLSRDVQNLLRLHNMIIVYIDI